MDDLTSFRHSSLPDSTSFIQLLDIVQAGPDKLMACNLLSWPIKSAPSYYALSYTWGDASSTAIIKLNGQSIRVRKNCEYALKQAFAFIPRRVLLWIDAICIDQASTQEKNHQVAIMGTIFQKAAHVLACVGPHADNSEILFDFMNRKVWLFRRILKKFHSSPHAKRDHWNMGNAIPETRVLAIECSMSMGSGQKQRLVDAWMKFLERPYFSRVWILQELHLASTITVCCGMNEHSFDRLLALTMLVTYWIHAETYRTISQFYKRKMFDVRPLRPPLGEPHFVTQESLDKIEHTQGCLALACSISSTARLPDVVSAMQSFHCTDVRDKFYGALSLVYWGDGPIPTPDYRRDNLEVATEVLRLFLAKESLAPPYGTAVNWARRLGELFMIHPELSRVQKAIGARSSTLKPSRKLEGSSLMSQDKWFGVQLRSSSIELAQDSARTTIHCSEARFGGLKELRDDQNTLIAYAPNHTRPGDWLMQDTVRLFDSPLDTIGIIIRATSTAEFIFVGPIFKINYHDKATRCMDNPKVFRVSWHPEDLLLLVLSHVFQFSLGKRSG